MQYASLTQININLTLCNRYGSNRKLYVCVFVVCVLCYMTYGQIFLKVMEQNMNPSMANS